MFHLAANFVALANVADTEVPALADDVLQIRNNRHTPQDDLQLVAAYSGAVTLLRTRLNVPTLRKVTFPFIHPVSETLLPPTDPNYMDLRNNPWPLKRDEGIVWQSTDSAAGPNNHHIISWLARNLEPVPPGLPFTIRGTGTGTAVANAWTSIVMTWDTDLTEGEYVVIGGQAISTTGIAFSLIFEGQYWRPGGLMGATSGVRPPWAQMNGGFGVWGRFRSLNPPQVRVLCNAADTAWTVFLDVIRIGGMPQG